MEQLPMSRSLQMKRRHTHREARDLQCDTLTGSTHCTGSDSFLEASVPKALASDTWTSSRRRYAVASVRLRRNLGRIYTQGSRARESVLPGCVWSETRPEELKALNVIIRAVGEPSSNHTQITYTLTPTYNTSHQRMHACVCVCVVCARTYFFFFFKKKG